MNIPSHAVVHLLHQCESGTLATHAREPAGYPYPSILPYVTDTRHRPMLLVSRLAEHTRNFEADPRVGFAVSPSLPAPATPATPTARADNAPGSVLSGPRLTLLGRIETGMADADLARRYCRYQPDAEHYLALGDFFFVTLVPERLRYIGGFGMMGWLDAAVIDAGVPLSGAVEDELVERFNALAPDGVRALGVDCLGVDLWASGMRRRDAFEAPALDADALAAAVLQCAARYCVD